MAEEKNPTVVSIEGRIKERQDEQKAFDLHMNRTGTAMTTLLAPAIHAMRDLGLDNRQIAEILAHAAELLGEDDAD